MLNVVPPMYGNKKFQCESIHSPAVYKQRAWPKRFHCQMNPLPYAPRPNETMRHALKQCPALAVVVLLLCCSSAVAHSKASEDIVYSPSNATLAENYPPFHALPHDVLQPTAPRQQTPFSHAWESIGVKPQCSKRHKQRPRNLPGYLHNVLTWALRAWSKVYMACIAMCP